MNKGAAVYEYKHRQAYQDVKRVKVHGDLQIEKVTLFAVRVFILFYRFEFYFV